MCCGAHTSMHPGMAGKGDFENAEIFALVDVVEDLWLKIFHFFWEKDEKRKVKRETERGRREGKWFGKLVMDFCVIRVDWQLLQSHLPHHTHTQHRARWRKHSRSHTFLWHWSNSKNLLQKTTARKGGSMVPRYVIPCIGQMYTQLVHTISTVHMSTIVNSFALH